MIYRNLDIGVYLEMVSWTYLSYVEDTPHSTAMARHVGTIQTRARPPRHKNGP